MISEQNSQFLILAGIFFLFAVLLGWAWMVAQRQWQAGQSTGRNLPSEDQPITIASLPLIGWWFNKFKLYRERWKNHWNVLFRWISPVLICAVIILATIPSVLVVRDRWLNIIDVRIPLSEDWCKLPLLCNMQLPRYFLFGGVCLLAAGLLVALFPLGREIFQNLRTEFLPTDDGIPNRQIQISRFLLWASLLGFLAVAALSVMERRRPGWELALVAAMYIAGWLLQDISLSRVGKFLRDNQAWLVACLLVHLALVVTLAVYFSAPGYTPLALAGLVLAAIYLFRHRQRVPAIYWIFNLGLILFSININAWWVSVAGDEYGFYVSARYLVEKADLVTVASRLFDEMGVYGQNTYLASIVQSLFMRVFGTLSFGWRFSNVYLAALSIPFFYFFFKVFLTRRVALGACFFLAVSEYLINFSKIGYVSLQSLFALSISLAAAAWAVRSGRMAAFAVAGAVLAMDFYSFGIALVGIPLAVLLMLWFVPPLTRLAGRRWAVFAAGFGILCFPLLFQPEFWRTGFGFTVFGSFAKEPPSSGLLQEFFNRIMTSWFSYLYVPNESHFVAVSFVDWMTAILVGIGFFAVLYKARRNRFAAFFLVGWGLLLAIAGVLGSPTLPSTTRMFVLLPWWAAAAAFGLQWILDRIPSGTRPGMRVRDFALAGILLAVVGINLYQATVVAYARWIDRQAFEAYVLRLAGHTRNPSSGAPDEFVFATYSSWALEPFILFQQLYPRDWIGLNVEKVIVDGSQLPESAVPSAADSKSIVIVIPTLPEEWQNGLRTSLEALGYHWCSVHTSYGKWVYDLYTPKGMEWVCSVAS
jgi:hypothetical protein